MNVKFVEEHHHVSADERHVQIARARTIGIEWLVGHPFVSRNGAAAEDHVHTGWRRVAKHLHEFLEASPVATEGEPDDAFPNRVLTFRRISQSSSLLEIAAEELERPRPRVLGRGEVRLLLGFVALRLRIVLRAEEAVDGTLIVDTEI